MPPQLASGRLMRQKPEKISSMSNHADGKKECMNVAKPMSDVGVYFHKRIYFINVTIAKTKD